MEHGDNVFFVGTVSIKYNKINAEGWATQKVQQAQYEARNCEIVWMMREVSRGEDV